MIFGILTLVVVSVVPWRTNDIYDGGADSVVIAKALVSISALGLSFLYYLRSPVKGTVGVRTLTLFLGIVVISALGAMAAGEASAALVLTVRILIVAATVTLVVKSSPPLTVLSTLLAALGAVAIVSAVTGAAHGLDDGRLAGGVPQMAPNVLAGLAAPPALGLAAHIVRVGLRPWNVGLLLGFVVIVFATGSRTALIVVFVGIACAFLAGGRLPASTAIMTIAVIPFAYALVVFTDTVATTFARGQSIEQISTLSSRTVAWQAVLSTPTDSWAKWIGIGLAAQTVEVQQRWRDVQVLDSSWVSVIAQAGVIGTLLLVIWCVMTSVESVRTRGLSALTTPLLIMLLIRSFTENGLIESSPTFLLFLAISLVLEPGTKFPGKTTRGIEYPLAIPLPALRAERVHAP
jgi:hypothetical protein